MAILHWLCCQSSQSLVRMQFFPQCFCTFQADFFFRCGRERCCHFLQSYGNCHHLGDGVPLGRGPAKLVEKLAGYTARDPVVVYTEVSHLNYGSTCFGSSRGLRTQVAWLWHLLWVLRATSSRCWFHDCCRCSWCFTVDFAVTGNHCYHEWFRAKPFETRSLTALFRARKICSAWTPLRTCLRELRRETTLKQMRSSSANPCGWSSQFGSLNRSLKPCRRPVGFSIDASQVSWFLRFIIWF